MFDCVDGQLARYTRPFSKLGAWLDSIFDRTKEYVVFAGLAIGASRTGDAVWLLAGAALALQTRAPRDRLLLSRSPSTRRSPRRRSRRSRSRRRAAAGVAADRAGRRPRRSRTRTRAAAAGARAADAEAARRAAVARDRPRAQLRWVKKILAFPIGERFAVISLTAALFDARTVLHRPARLGRLRAALHPARPHAAVAGVMSAAAIPSAAPAPPSAASCSRPTATTGRSRRVGAALGRRVPAAAVALLVAAGLPLLLALVARGRRRLERRSWPAWSRGWCCSAGSRGAPADRPAALGACRPRCARSSTAACCGSPRSPAATPGRPRSRCCARSPSATTTSCTGCATAACAPPAGYSRRRRLGRPAGRSASCCWSRARCRRRSSCWPCCWRCCSWRDRRRVAALPARPGAGLRRRGGRGRMIGMVLAAGAGRRLQPLTETCRRRCCRSTATARSSTSRSATFAASGCETVVVVTGFAAERIEERRAELEERHGVTLETRLQPEGARSGTTPTRCGARASTSRAACCCATATPCTRPRSRSGCWPAAATTSS